MASIHPYRTSKGERRYRVKYRDGGGRQRTRSFTARADARSFKVDIERRRQAGTLYRVETERFGRTAEAWLERYMVGAAGRVRPRPKSVALVRDGLVTLAPLSDLPIDRIHRPQVEDVVADLARRAPRRAEMTLALLKRILKAAEARGQIVDHAVFAVRVASPDDREPRYLTWEEADEVRSWLPEFVSRIVPIAILTMLRRGEIIALRDRDVDFVSGAITVAAQAQDGERTRTKTRAGQRTVDVRTRRSGSSGSSSSPARPTKRGCSSPRAPAFPSTRTTSWAATSNQPHARPAFRSSPSMTSAIPVPR